MLVVSLANLEGFREIYGFVASDDVLRAVSLMIQNVMRRIGNLGDFLGHLGPTDFVLVTSPEKAPLLKERIRTQLEQSLEYFYPIKDREQAASGGKWLAVEFGVLLPIDGNFTDCGRLKSVLLAKKSLECCLLRITAIIPTYNEAENLPRLVSALFALPLNLTLLVVDDNSPDGTGQLADELAAQHPGRIGVIHRSGKLGLRIISVHFLTPSYKMFLP